MCAYTPRYIKRFYGDTHTAQYKRFTTRNFIPVVSTYYTKKSWQILTQTPMHVVVRRLYIMLLGSVPV